MPVMRGPLFRPDKDPNQPHLQNKESSPIKDEQMCWLTTIESIPWSPTNTTIDSRRPCKLPCECKKWRAWNIVFPEDLFSLFGTIHLLDRRFSEEGRGKQYLAGCMLACVMSQTCGFAVWTPGFIDRIVLAADKYHEKVLDKIGTKQNHEICLEDFQGVESEIVPYKFSVQFENVIFGFMYNSLPDRFNLNQALSFFFENHAVGILVCPVKNLAFGKIGTAYFLFDCQSQGWPLHNKTAYMLKCDSLNRLIYCITLILNVRCHNQQFNLYSVSADLQELPTPKIESKDFIGIPGKSSSSNKSLKGSDKSSEGGRPY